MKPAELFHISMNFYFAELVLCSKIRWCKDGYKGMVEAIIKLLNLKIGKRKYHIIYPNFIRKRCTKE